MTRIALACLLLAGCAHTEPRVEIRTVQVKVEVPTPCPKDFPALPSLTPNAEILSATPEVRSKLVGANYVRLLPWAVAADKAMRECQK